MPLVKSTEYVVVNHETHPDIPMGEAYRLRRYLNWVQFDGLNKIKALKIQAPNMFGNRGGSEKMDVSIDLVTLHKAYLETYVLEWSFPEPVLPETLAMIDPASKDVLVRVIDELQNEQGGIKLDDPLDEKLTGFVNVSPNPNQLNG